MSKILIVYKIFPTPLRQSSSSILKQSLSTCTPTKMYVHEVRASMISRNGYREIVKEQELLVMNSTQTVVLSLYRVKLVTHS